MIGAVLLFVGCSDTSEDPKPQSTPILPTIQAPVTVSTLRGNAAGVNAPFDTGVSKNTGMEVSIVSVEDINSRYGPVTVFTFQLTNVGEKVFDGYNWPTPTIVYGAAGSPAEHTVSLTEQYGAGVQGAVPPGSRQTVKHAYKVPKAQLNPAVVSAGSVIWQGDFSTFQR
ncbi:hypothetical protein IU479_27230 [Nocardia abscessus]|uniref:hypothetical protein n=1 Tax=Nocardia abscessus TaxID=120957 RepID=UPI001892E4CF|nr:hypothetical protein [Nocardia abscessus]MBF6221792.1 hypothetical protein [Nocardia abscessus]